MDSKDFHKHSAKALEHIDTAIGELDLDGIDIQLAGDVLTIGFADGGRFVINAHSAAGQIWMAAARRTAMDMQICWSRPGITCGMASRSAPCTWSPEGR